MAKDVHQHGRPPVILERAARGGRAIRKTRIGPPLCRDNSFPQSVGLATEPLTSEQENTEILGVGAATEPPSSERVTTKETYLNENKQGIKFLYFSARTAPSG